MGYVTEGPDIHRIWNGQLECTYFICARNASWPLLRQSGLLLWKCWRICETCKRELRKFRRRRMDHEGRTERAGMKFLRIGAGYTNVTNEIRMT